MKLPPVEIWYRKGNCEKNPFGLRLEPPLLSHELHFIELPPNIRNEIIKGLDTVISEFYFEEIKAKNYSFYK